MNMNGPELKGTIDVNGVNGRASSTVRTLGIDLRETFIADAPFEPLGTPLWTGKPLVAMMKVRGDAGPVNLEQTMRGDGGHGKLIEGTGMLQENELNRIVKRGSRCETF